MMQRWHAAPCKPPKNKCAAYSLFLFRSTFPLIFSATCLPPRFSSVQHWPLPPHFPHSSSSERRPAHVARLVHNALAKLESLAAPSIFQHLKCSRWGSCPMPPAAALPIQPQVLSALLRGSLVPPRLHATCRLPPLLPARAAPPRPLPQLRTYCHAVSGSLFHTSRLLLPCLCKPCTLAT